LIENAELIVEGTVNAIESRWNEEKTMIYTDITVTVNSIEKGEFRESFLTVRLLGGHVGKDIVVVDGSPGFAIGEYVLLFLAESKPGTLKGYLGESTTSKLSKAYHLINLGQGKFTIIDDPVIGKRAISNMVNMEFVNRVQESIDLQNVTLPQLKQAIRENINKK
jgi:hypothetical protein